MLAGINKDALTKPKEDEQKVKQQSEEEANSSVTSSSNAISSPAQDKKLQNKKGIKNLFGLLSLGNKKSGNESVNHDPEFVEANGNESIDQFQPPLSSEAAAASEVSTSDVIATDDGSNAKSSAIPNALATKKVPAALRRRSLQRVVSVKHAQNIAAAKAKANDESASLATQLSLDDGSLHAEEAWERKAEKEKQEAATESLLLELQQAAEEEYEEVWEKKAVEKQAEEHTVKILRRLSQLDGSAEVAAALATATMSQDMDLEEDLYEEAWERKVTQKVESRSEQLQGTVASSHGSVVAEQVQEVEQEMGSETPVDFPEDSGSDDMPNDSPEESITQELPEEEIPLDKPEAEEIAELEEEEVEVVEED
jgi:hypothetical protein